MISTDLCAAPAAVTAPGHDAIGASLPMPDRATLGWTLPVGGAMGWRAPAAGQLLLCQGRVWLTFDGPHGRREGDLVLVAGQSLALPAGARVVLETWPEAGAPGLAARLAWQAQPQAAGATLATGWREQARGSLGQPWRDLRLALAGGGGAALRLLLGGAGFALFLVASFPGVERGLRAFSALSSARRAQGAM